MGEGGGPCNLYVAPGPCPSLCPDIWIIQPCSPPSTQYPAPSTLNGLVLMGMVSDIIHFRLLADPGMANVHTLRLAQNSLDDLPIELASCPAAHNVNTLDISRNKFSALPAAIAGMPSLAVRIRDTAFPVPGSERMGARGNELRNWMVGRSMWR